MLQIIAPLMDLHDLLITISKITKQQKQSDHSIEWCHLSRRIHHPFDIKYAIMEGGILDRSSDRFYMITGAEMGGVASDLDRLSGLSYGIAGHADIWGQHVR